MVKPSRRAGQRSRATCLRTTRGRLGSNSAVSAPSAATPAVAARRMNFRLEIGRKDNRFQALSWGKKRAAVLTFEHSANPPIRDMTRGVPGIRTRTWPADRCGGWPYRPARTDLPGERWAGQRVEIPELHWDLPR